MHMTRDPGFPSVILALNPSLSSRTPCLTLAHSSSIRLLWRALLSNTIHLPVKTCMPIPACLTRSVTFAESDGREPLTWLLIIPTIRCLHSSSCEAFRRGAGGAATPSGAHLQPPLTRSSALRVSCITIIHCTVHMFVWLYIDETNKRKQAKPSALASGASFRRCGVGIVIEKINLRESATIK